MGWRRSIIVFALVALAAAVPARAQTGYAAMIKTLSGAAFVVDAATGARNPAAVGTKLQAGDKLVTGADGAMGVTFTDNTTLSLGPSSEIVVERYAYDPAADDYGFATRIVQGTFLFVTGQIAKYAPQATSVTTPAGSIGIRGTRFLVKVEPK